MQNRARLISRIYAVLVLLVGCVVVIFGILMFWAINIGRGPPPSPFAFLVPGVAFILVTESVWRGRAWALFGTWVFALLCWLILWGQSGEYRLLIVIPVAFSLLDLYIHRLGGVTFEANEDAPPPAGF